VIVAALLLVMKNLRYTSNAYASNELAPAAVIDQR